MAETVHAMDTLVRQGKVLYWGTSEWSAAQIGEALDVAHRHNLQGPTMEQPQYNLLHRGRVDQDYADLCTEAGLGLTTFSPLASGVLTGKYASGFAADTRLGRPDMGWLQDLVLGGQPRARLAQVQRFTALASTLGLPPAALAIAWCLRNPNVSSVILGASRVPQLLENLRALELLDRVDQGSWEKIEAVFA